jgi:hypothetical protein
VDGKPGLIIGAALLRWQPRDGACKQSARYFLGMPAKGTINLDAVAQLIVTVRSRRVILAKDLAAIYGVPAKALNQAVSRNADRFPEDFAFRITRAEGDAILVSRSQTVTLKRGTNAKFAPMVFTEHGAIMAASVLNSPRAAQMSVFVVRAFLRLREWVSNQTVLAAKLAELENRVTGHDGELEEIFRTIRQLLQPAPENRRPRIGFNRGSDA